MHRQLETAGKIRLVVIKSRQQGITTLCHAIMLWRIMAKPHSNILIMANSQKNLEQHHFKDFVKMAEHFFGKEMLCPVGNNTKGGMRGFAFTSVHLTEIAIITTISTSACRRCFPASPIRKAPVFLLKALYRDWMGTCIVLTNAIPGLSFCFCRGTIKLNMHYRRTFRRR